ncbi:hypothetical protein L484_011898 [Morus notabilis]|uniref:Non-haem dioxygenase N-terminal domain-containing protein n=1 Tax=Morus notabilis TaxID=981085 RepID=W9S2F8_9ROSA|nr:hypothetical protein L484_011898 [Morus notabilis]
MDSEPPFEEAYNTLVLQSSLNTMKDDHKLDIYVGDCNLPLINLSHLSSHDQLERERCINEIAQAASNWGFFQVVNHGISVEVLESLEYEQKNLFNQPFEKKIQSNFLNLPSNSYRWGNPKATCLKQLSWSEAVHISITDASAMSGSTECNNLSYFKASTMAVDRIAKMEMVPKPRRQSIPCKDRRGRGPCLDLLSSQVKSREGKRNQLSDLDPEKTP